MKKRPKTTPYPVRLTSAQRKEVTRTAIAVNLPDADTVRHALELGLPALRVKFGK